MKNKHINTSSFDMSQKSCGSTFTVMIKVKSGKEGSTLKMTLNVLRRRVPNYSGTITCEKSMTGTHSMSCDDVMQ